ncbi:Aste57867_11984 [Aphanomyces stellatus]|uniref:Aste57867_11984 protein n=1 Tax=Aphanomyces stellatus TaxID=120398 RepID=A0A485KWD6_9STRA|nr:hypothetical protein As57867_011939 [Aphanomyces stellatus]VFT88839.1 Aste57867_11984 [Aphanomyces stellatus]
MPISLSRAPVFPVKFVCGHKRPQPGSGLARRPRRVLCTRCAVQTQIELLLRAQRRDAPPEMLAKLPQLARKLEWFLFRAAQSHEEFVDVSTLRVRIATVIQEQRTLQ